MPSASVAVPLAAFVLYLGLLTVTLAASRQSQIHRAFAIYLLCMMVWSLSSFAVRVGLLVDNPLLWTRILISASTGLPIFFYHFVRAFLGLKSNAWPLYAGYASYSISVLITFLTDWVVRDAYIDGPKYYLKQGPVMPLIAIWGVILMGLSVYELAQRYAETQDNDYRNRIRYPLVGVAFIVLGSASNRIPALSVYPLDIAANAVNALILAYSILRYELINITPVLRQGMTYFLVTAAVGGGYMASFFILGRLAQRFGTLVLPLVFLVGVLISLAFPPLRDRGQLLVNRLLFRRRYAVQRMLQRLSSTAAEMIDLQGLADLILDEVTTTMGIDSACIFLRDAPLKEFYIAASKGIDEVGKKIRWRADHPILSWLSTVHTVLTSGEVDLKPEFRAMWGQEREELDRLAAEAFIPLRVKDDVVGVFAVGPKSSRVPYTPDDKIALATLANQTAVAMEKARLYDMEQRRLKESLILLDISTAVASTLDLTQVLKLIAQRTAEACGVHRCSIFLLDEQRQRILPLMSQFASGETDEQLWERYRYRTYVQPIDEVPVLKQIFLDRQPLVLGADSIGCLPDAWVRPFDVRSLAIVPLISRDRAIGAMALDHVGVEKRFEQEQINLAMTIGGQAAAAIENARLHEQTIQEKARAEIILQETFSGIVVIDDSLNIVSMNPGAEAISGYAAEQALGKRICDVFGAEIGGSGSPITRACETGERVPPVEITISAKQGTRDVLLGATPLSAAGHMPRRCLLSFADISRLKEVDRLKSNIVANVSHELRTPLSSIKAYTELLLLGAEEADAELRQSWLSVIDRETDRLAALINNFLDLSRLESGRIELIRGPLHLGDVVADVIALLQVQAEPRHIAIDLDVQPGLPTLLAEEGLMRSVVKNLISNAIKFSDDGGHVHVSVSEDNGNLKCAVEDNGIGIPQEAIPHLFTKFFRVPSAVAADRQGTGLGLALAREAVAAHGGYIEVQSTLGKGSRFTVVIPKLGSADWASRSGFGE
jgi:PAS domain S-box-containing protein